MAASIVVNRELLNATADAIDNNLEHATAVANNYLANHENVVSGTLFTGDAATASLAAAGQLNDHLQQTISGCHRLSHGLRRAAILMDQHELDAAHGMTSLFSDPGTVV